MRKLLFTEEQIAHALKQAAAEAPTPERHRPAAACRLALLGIALLFSGCCTRPLESGAEQARGERSRWVSTTYPIWGLPRDLADAPLTMLNRSGFGTFMVREPADFSVEALEFGAFVGVAVSLVTWIPAGFTASVRYGGIWALSIGGGLIASDLIYGLVVTPLQVALLRTGVDYRFLKHEDWKSAGHDSPERLRSRAFFPNWRYLVNTPDTTTIEEEMPNSGQGL